MLRWLCWLACLGVGFWPVTAAAVSATITETDPPIEINADRGIEWERNGKVVRARGNVFAKRGDFSVTAETISAYYRKSTAGENEIWRLEASGDVIIDREGEQAYAEEAIYELDEDRVTLYGGTPNRLVGEDGELLADDLIEYWIGERRLVARGNVLAREESREIRAATLTAFLDETQAGELQLSRVDAEGNVQVIQENDVVRADKAHYDAQRRVATVTGSVRITRAGNQLNGCRAEVDLNTGVNRLLPCGNETQSRTRVHGLVDPQAVRNQPAGN